MSQEDKDIIMNGILQSKMEYKRNPEEYVNNISKQMHTDVIRKTD